MYHAPCTNLKGPQRREEKFASQYQVPLKLSVGHWQPRAQLQSRKPHKPQNRPKIPARHPNFPPRQGIEKYPENTTNKKTTNIRFSYLGLFQGVFEGVFRGISHFLYVGRSFCISWAVLCCSWSRCGQGKRSLARTVFLIITGRSYGRGGVRTILNMPSDRHRQED